MSEKVGLSIRLIRSYDAQADAAAWKAAGEIPMHDKAFMLALHDEREIPMIEKLRDAFAFLKSRIQ